VTARVGDFLSIGLGRCFAGGVRTLLILEILRLVRALRCPQTVLAVLGLEAAGAALR
jgi:hypothetical protein